MHILLILGHFGCSVVTSVTFSSNLGNLRKKINGSLKKIPHKKIKKSKNIKTKNLTLKNPKMSPNIRKYLKSKKN